MHALSINPPRGRILAAGAALLVLAFAVLAREPTRRSSLPT